MKVIDFLEVCDENMTVILWDKDDKFVAQYDGDGKDLIDKKYNEYKVLGVSGGATRDVLDVIVEESDGNI